MSAAEAFSRITAFLGIQADLLERRPACQIVTWAVLAFKASEEFLGRAGRPIVANSLVMKSPAWLVTKIPSRGIEPLRAIPADEFVIA
jgi:hypothetical protein